jgi:tetratricopeptide (TPR) repeat protein
VEVRRQYQNAGEPQNVGIYIKGENMRTVFAVLMAVILAILFLLGDVTRQVFFVVLVVFILGEILLSRVPEVMTRRAAAYLGPSRAPTGDLTVVDPGNRSDVFISYRRTRFGEQVRRVAELLISQGVSVWLDDYALFATDIREDVVLAQAISAGIALADQTVVFLTADYAESKWCASEKSELETRFRASPQAILTLDEQALGDEGEAARMIIQKLGLAASPPPAVVGGTSRPVEQNWLRDERAGYQFDATGWDTGTRGGYFDRENYQGPILDRRDDPHQRRLSIRIGPDVITDSVEERVWRETPHDRRLAIIRRALWDLFEGTPPEDKDEKELWKEGYRYVTHYATYSHVSLRGTHLFLMGRNYHFALTYWSESYWLRRYSIVATDRLTNLRIEVAIVMRFHGRFAEFCAAAREFDALVHTFSRLGVGASRPLAVRPGSEARWREAMALTNAASSDVEHGLIEEARAKLEAALQLYELADTHNEYGLICLLSANYSEAKKHAVQAIALEPENPKFWSSLCRLYEDLNRPGEALRCMVVAQMLDPDYPTVTKAMARLRRKMGGRADAPPHREVAARIIEMRGRYHDGYPLDAEQLERILCEGL